jgi:hypothetical protein
MAFREVRVFEVREVLRLFLRGEGLRSTERLVGVDRKTVRRYLAAAGELGLVVGGGDEQLTEMVTPAEAWGPMGASIRARPVGCRCRWPYRILPDVESGP